METEFVCLSMQTTKNPLYPFARETDRDMQREERKKKDVRLYGVERERYRESGGTEGRAGERKEEAERGKSEVSRAISEFGAFMRASIRT